MTTITRLKQLRDWLDGKIKEERVQRQPQPTPPTTLLFALSEYVPDRFASFRDKIIPNLRNVGYAYFLSCDSDDYIAHQEWCNDHCQDHTLPYRDVWQVSSVYPRAFANKADAAMFKIHFDATNIE